MRLLLAMHMDDAIGGARDHVNKLFRCYRLIRPRDRYEINVPGPAPMNTDCISKPSPDVLCRGDGVLS